MESDNNSQLIRDILAGKGHDAMNARLKRAYGDPPWGTPTYHELQACILLLLEKVERIEGELNPDDD